MTTKETFWERKNRLNDDFVVLGSVADPATVGQITAYEKSSGYVFSEDVKDFLVTFGTLLFEVKEEVWRRPKVYDVMPAWKFGYGFFVYGLSKDEETPAWMTFEEKNQEALEYKEKTLGQMFFKKTGNGYRAYTNNGVITIEHDKYDETDIEVFEGNIYDFLIAEIDKLEEDYLEYINEKSST
ncbi:hypothetical protein [Cellulophaga fucicola]|uniref:Knr4/Smi1-like domain-containing protein n=1 Tax=Cellulophaga fucicola TaxID=76595 RepID=A0A1K1NWK2_9FLAO|nr:hypothetical protein [Cellulophaga fucicola]SFW39679.1 hypothetical protein SAMN05660313_01420 [Cellulophaga fucicola]